MINSKGRKAKIRNKKPSADYSGLSWKELVVLASERGVYKFGMKKPDVLAAL